MQISDGALVDHVEIEIHARRGHGEGRAAELLQPGLPFIGALVDVGEQQAAQHAARIALAIAGARPYFVDEGELARAPILVEPEQERLTRGAAGRGAIEGGGGHGKGRFACVAKLVLGEHGKRGQIGKADRAKIGPRAESSLDTLAMKGAGLRLREQRAECGEPARLRERGVDAAPCNIGTPGMVRFPVLERHGQQRECGRNGIAQHFRAAHIGAAGNIEDAQRSASQVSLFRCRLQARAQAGAALW